MRVYDDVPCWRQTFYGCIERTTHFPSFYSKFSIFYFRKKKSNVFTSKLLFIIIFVNEISKISIVLLSLTQGVWRRDCQFTNGKEKRTIGNYYNAVYHVFNLCHRPLVKTKMFFSF